METSFFHITTRRRLAGISRHGLLPSKAIDKRKAVYAVHEERAQWAGQHIAKRHKAKTSDLVVLIVVDDERNWKRGGENYHYCPRRVPWSKVVAILAPEELCQRR